MPSYPNRCQHIKVNGTQCGSPALRRNRFCYFHKLHHEEIVELNVDRLKDARARLRKVAVTLPVLEDANSIQVSLMQIMRLIITGQIDGKTAGLLLYALQIASANLNRTNFEPYKHSVILDPNAVSATPLGADIWDDSDFDEEEDEAEDDEADSKTAAACKTKTAANAKVKPPVNAPPAKRPPTNVNLNDVRKQITSQICEGLPEIAAAYASVNG